MAEHWWRAYDGSIDHPKLLRLSDAMHRAWFTLQCIASANGGTLPPAADIALRLRMKPTKVCEWISHLVAGGLIDNDAGTFRPHNWDERQYKTDTKDPTGASRAKNYRDRKRDAKRDDRDATVTRERPDTEQTTEQIDRIVDAGASRFTEGSKALASALWKALGIDSPIACPPELAGADWRAIGWEQAGWTVDLIETEARRVGPDKPLSYYEKVFATAFAKRQAPLPVVEVREAEKLTVNHGTSERKSGSLIAAIDRQLAALEAEAGAHSALPENSVLRISG